MNFEFATSGRILFGEGRAGEVGALAASLGSRALVVQGGAGRNQALARAIEENGVSVTTMTVANEPTIGVVEQGVDLARRAECQLVVAIGGGSVIDAAKAIAALVANPGAVRDYLEVIGSGKPLVREPVQLIALPTTAGAGAEVTRNAVLAAPEERVKVSLRSPLMLPDIVLIDPELTYGLPPSITASTGLDALTQCIEPFVTPLGNPLTDAVAREGLRRISGALRRAWSDGGDTEARRDMAIGSLCGGLALANAKLGAVHGFAAPLGGISPVPHGVACARLLAPVMHANVRALRAKDASSPALGRYEEAAQLLTGNPRAAAEDGVAWVRELVEELHVPRLSDFGVQWSDVADVVRMARSASSMKGNPVELTEEELSTVLEAAL